MGKLAVIHRVRRAYVGLAIARNREHHAAIRRIKIHSLPQRKPLLVEHQVHAFGQLQHFALLRPVHLAQRVHPRPRRVDDLPCPQLICLPAGQILNLGTDQPPSFVPELGHFGVVDRHRPAGRRLLEHLERQPGVVRAVLHIVTAAQQTVLLQQRLSRQRLRHRQHASPLPAFHSREEVVHAQPQRRAESTKRAAPINR
ncbi:hypothetical protein D3C74_310860 [compost metagenome]